ncbi:MAG: HTTM domain-containing protein [Pirellulales bacterium]
MPGSVVEQQPELESAAEQATIDAPATDTPTHPAAPGRVVGLAPWLPKPLAEWNWFAATVRAERLAALRIGLGFALLLDVLVTYWPQRQALLGAGSLGSAEVFAGRFRAPLWNWSLLGWADQPAAINGVLIAWALAAACLMLGVRPRAAALVAWMIGISVLNTNYYIHNAGDRIRQVALLYLMLSPCGAVWSLDALLARRRSSAHERGPVYVWPWPLRLLVVLLAVMYCTSGIIKLTGETWQSGRAIEHMVSNVAWSRWSFAQLPLPWLPLLVLTWLALIWEVGFPIWIAWRPTRKAAWLIGVAFHLATGVALKLGMFPVYVLCCYLPLLRWEKLSDGARDSAATPQQLPARSVD